MFGKNKIITDPEKIEKLLTHNVEEIFVEDSLRKKLLSGDKLRIKLGFDPTGSNIHIGRAIILRKLKEFQDLGHKITFIVGTFTAQIGDPSDKLEKRPMLRMREIEKNLKNYKEQVGKILDLNKVSFHYNGDWLGKMKFHKVAELAESFTVAQMTARRNFKERLDKGDNVSLREFLYPLMQGYDSVHLKSDVEIGGYDQLFNLKAGRIIQRHYGQPEQDIMATVMLEGTDGRKMSTSQGNVINITDEPSDMFGAVMSLRDDLIVKYFKACTDVEKTKIDEIEKALKENRLNPKEAKEKLATEIITIYHNKTKAKHAKENWNRTFSQGGVPEDTPEIKVSKGTELSQVLVDEKIISSKSEWSRLVKGGGISSIEKDQKITNPHYVISESMTYKVGKRRWIKTILE